MCSEPSPPRTPKSGKPHALGLLDPPRIRRAGVLLRIVKVYVGPGVAGFRASIAFTAEPELAYPEGTPLKSTRPSGPESPATGLCPRGGASGDPAQNSTGHINSLRFLSMPGPFAYAAQVRLTPQETRTHLGPQGIIGGDSAFRPLNSRSPRGKIGGSRGLQAPE